MPEIRIVESAVDWLTVTAHTEERAIKLARFGWDLAMAQTAQDNKATEFELYGYSGVHAGSVSYGVRNDGAILQISGPAAAEHFVKAMRLGENVTRLDLQVTIRQKPFDDFHASSAYCNRPEQVAGKGRTPGYRYWEASMGGATLYVGAPSSDMMGRLYNKAVESKEAQYAYCWRYELQLRRRAANTVAQSLTREVSQTERTAAIVWWWFRDRGVVPPFDAKTTNGLGIPPRPKSDATRKLAWLAKAVRPTVEWLGEIGKCNAMLQALGLSEMLDATSVPGLVPDGATTVMASQEVLVDAKI